MSELVLDIAFFDDLKLTPLWGQEKRNPEVHLRLVDRETKESWYVIEGSRQGDDYRFYGLRAHIPGHLSARGNFRLSELSHRPLIADVSVKGKRLGEILYHQFDAT